MAQTAQIFPSVGSDHFPYAILSRATGARVLSGAPSQGKSFTLIKGPWAASVSNSAIAQVVPLEDEFAMFAAEALDWAEASLPLAVETWPDE